MLGRRVLDSVGRWWAAANGRKRAPVAGAKRVARSGRKRSAGTGDKRAAGAGRKGAAGAGRRRAGARGGAGLGVTGRLRGSGELLGAVRRRGSRAAGKTRAQLYEIARKRNLPGRSKMRKDELARKLGMR
jgi:hypothetical protein